MKRIYCDGSCIQNGHANASAGWSIIIIDEDATCISVSGKIPMEFEQSNNVAELYAMFMALFYAASNSETVMIYSDSETTINGITGYSTRKANRNVWEKIESLIHEISVPVRVRKIPRNSDRFAAMADKEATAAANALILA